MTTELFQYDAYQIIRLEDLTDEEINIALAPLEIVVKEEFENGQQLQSND